MGSNLINWTVQKHKGRTHAKWTKGGRRADAASAPQAFSSPRGRRLRGIRAEPMYRASFVPTGGPPSSPIFSRSIGGELIKKSLFPVKVKNEGINQKWSSVLLFLRIIGIIMFSINRIEDIWSVSKRDQTLLNTRFLIPCFPTQYIKKLMGYQKCSNGLWNQIYSSRRCGGKISSQYFNI